jgi:hypothetical protein
MHFQITEALMPEKFQTHPNLKKLSMEACMHAAQNELLPLVVALFFEKARAAVASGKVTELPSCDDPIFFIIITKHLHVY